VPYPEPEGASATHREEHVVHPTVPAIPMWLAHLPTVGGLVVPWITSRDARGRHQFGTVDHERMNLCLRQRLCGVCGRELDDRLVLLMRLSDLTSQCTNEPALHPQCAAYASGACPMVAGRLDRYRTTVEQDHEGAESAIRSGAPAEPWFAVWLRGYEVVLHHGHLAASHRGQQPLRIRPISWVLPTWI
jgi:hypothetical protein